MNEAMLYLGALVVILSALFTVGLLVVAMFTPAPQSSWIGKPKGYWARVLERMDQL